MSTTLALEALRKATKLVFMNGTSLDKELKAAIAALEAEAAQPVQPAQGLVAKWKQMAEYQYALRAYPTELHLGGGALDAYFKNWNYDTAIAKAKS